LADGTAGVAQPKVKDELPSAQHQRREAPFADALLDCTVLTLLLLIQLRPIAVRIHKCGDQRRTHVKDGLFSGGIESDTPAGEVIDCCVNVIHLETHHDRLPLNDRAWEASVIDGKPTASCHPELRPSWVRGLDLQTQLLGVPTREFFAVGRVKIHYTHAFDHTTSSSKAASPTASASRADPLPRARQAWPLPLLAAQRP
jgi:hypothetical protein